MKYKDMIAPCGIDCTYCYTHLREKNSCPGCRSDNHEKPKSCLNCSKKQCVLNKKIGYCYECNDFPCSRMKSFNKRYVEKYNGGVIENLEIIRDKGLDYFIFRNKKRLTCPECRGKLSLHYGICADCGKTFKIPDLIND